MSLLIISRVKLELCKFWMGERKWIATTAITFDFKQIGENETLTLSPSQWRINSSYLPFSISLSNQNNLFDVQASVFFSHRTFLPSDLSFSKRRWFFLCDLYFFALDFDVDSIFLVFILRSCFVLSFYLGDFVDRLFPLFIIGIMPEIAVAVSVPVFVNFSL